MRFRRQRLARCRRQPASSLEHACFANDLALFTPQEIEVDPFYD